MSESDGSDHPQGAAQGPAQGTGKGPTEGAGPESRRLFAEARELIPGGVNSPVRAFGYVGGDPLFVASGSGARITDADGREFVDWVGSWGPMLLGHDHPRVREAVIGAARHGTSFGAPHESEVRLARLVVEAVPSVERVRFVNSGTEATMSAVRLARAYTDRERILKFRGGYHGHGDAFLVDAGSGAATLGVPSSPGVPRGAAADTLVAEYNDLAGVGAALESHPDEVACVIVEPVAGNMGCVAPAPGFLEGLRRLCDEHGALLVFDEVMTGFRVAHGGAQKRFGVRPDLTTLGKVVGGGLPVGAYGGAARIMERVAPEGDVYQAGTLSGNPLAMSAGIAMLELLVEDPGVYERIEALGRRLDEGIGSVLAAKDRPLAWVRVGAMGSLHFVPGPVRGWRDVEGADRVRFATFFRGMLARGIYLPPSPFEAWFLSAAHSDADVDDLVESAAAALDEAFDG